MMKRVWRISQFHKFRSFNPHSLSGDEIVAKPSVPFQVIRRHATQSPDSGGNRTVPPDVIALFMDKWSCNDSDTLFKKDLRKKVTNLKDQLLDQNDDEKKFDKVLVEYGAPLFRIYSDGSAVVELLTQLKAHPNLALEVLNWRRKQLDSVAPMTVEEYVKGITMASRLKDVNLALELFKEASNKQLNRVSLYNALMSAYLYNGMPVKCESLFKELKRETAISPSIVTYNILISSYGRMMLIDHMEETLREIKDSNLTPTLQTYKALITGYITAWMWHKMEKAYLTMKAGPIKPDIQIHMLMIRGYANSGQLSKMEEMYEMIRENVDRRETPLVRTMILAYCRSSDTSRVEKVEELLTLIPADEYRPWLNLLLICLYAKEDSLEQMEKSINEAFDRKAFVTSAGIMKCIIGSYFRHNAVDKLADFVQRAECAGWKICRSLYHCKMCMYSSQMRLSEMERVLDEMERINMPFSRKTLWILFNAYRRWGERSKLDQVVGMLCKHGVQFEGIPFVEILP